MRAALLALLAAGGLGAGCAALPPAPAGAVHTAPPPSAAERYCAWYADARDGVLYAGAAPFWWALRAEGGDPRADLARPGPQLVTRFDLSEERWLPPLPVGAEGARTGVWDVLALPDGRVFFTAFFEPAGFVDPATGRVVRLPELGRGLNEVAPGPDGSLLVTRYGDPEAPRSRPTGSVLVVDPQGRLLAEHPLTAPPGLRLAPKTPAFDPVRREIWVTSDLLDAEDRALAHPTVVLAPDGAELRRFPEPEVQFLVFAPDGTGYRAEVAGRQLWLAIDPPGAAPRRVLLDEAFPAQLDFAQELRRTEDGRVVVTRWSGRVHLVNGGEVRTLHLPRLEEDGLYYTAVARGRRVCATYCAGVTVVCENAPSE